jgi:GT2 family glycosyltransferase
MFTKNSPSSLPSLDVIICTYHRVDDLERTLRSLIIQLHKPNRILIVDNADDAATEALVHELTPALSACGIELTYERNTRGNSLTVARNIGIDRSNHDVLLFLDDDVELAPEYVREILQFLANQPSVMAAQGYIDRPAPDRVRNWLYRIMGEFHFRPKICRATSSISAIYPFPKPNQPIPCTFLSGANHAVRRSVFTQLRYDEKLQKYADGEDLDMGLRISRVFRNGLYLVPTATLIHLSAPAGRLPSHDLILMQEVYGLYLLKKLFPGSPFSWVFYLWSRLSRALFRLATAIPGSPDRRALLKYTFAAYGYCLTHLRQILKGDLQLPAEPSSSERTASK